MITSCSDDDEKDDDKKEMSRPDDDKKEMSRPDDDKKEVSKPDDDKKDEGKPDDDKKEEGSNEVVLPSWVVDLGLPSGTLWATCNVGAELPEEVGYYFAWGETEPKSEYYKSSWAYKVDWNSSNLQELGVIGPDKILPPEYDAATVNCGPKWRMPTEKEGYELVKYCESKFVTVNGVNGHMFTGPNGNQMFIPFGGLFRDKAYWLNERFYCNTSTVSGGSVIGGTFIEGSGKNGVSTGNSYGNCVGYDGYNVRPVLNMTLDELIEMLLAEEE